MIIEWGNDYPPHIIIQKTRLVKQHNSWGWNILHTYSFLVYLTRDMLMMAYGQEVPNKPDSLTGEIQILLNTIQRA